MTDYLILVNAENPLPKNFEETIELVETVNAENDTYKIEKKTYEAFLRLKEDIWENDGMQIELPDVWLPGGEVWLVPRTDKAFTVKGTEEALTETTISLTPNFSNTATLYSALSTKASALRPYFSKKFFSILPVFEPTRTGILCAFTQSATYLSSVSPPMLPGLIRILSAPCSMAAIAIR